METRQSLWPTAIVFALLAGLSRLYFEETYSRYQVLVFVGIAAGFELVRRVNGTPADRAVSFVGNALAAFFAIVFVKWQLEGISVSHWANLIVSAV